MIIIIASLISLAGLGIALLGIRGRRVSDALHCRKCRYELTGLDDPQQCPECGAQLAVPRAVRQGLRQKRVGIIALGSLLLLLGITPFTVTQIAAARDIDLNAYKPEWLLLMELGDSKARDGIVAELKNRFGHTPTKRWIAWPHYPRKEQFNTKNLIYFNSR